uniref:Uncharacterized protein n=1 Tax=Anopheles stephensi TaxID=30069 RepID=A0A182YB21_ANOST
MLDKIGVKPEDRFTPQDVIRQMRLGLVIDLTNTRRYYNPSDFISEGIDHVQVSIPGKVVPQEHLVRRFIDVVNTYLDDPTTEGKLIGVHCTHGLNRTGYLICAYMIQQLGYEPKEAIELFNAKRGHEMERNNYLQSLQRMMPAKRRVMADAPRMYVKPSPINEIAPCRSHDGPGWQQHGVPRAQDGEGWRQERAPREQDSERWRQERAPREQDSERRRQERAPREQDSERWRQERAPREQDSERWRQERAPRAQDSEGWRLPTHGRKRLLEPSDKYDDVEANNVYAPANEYGDNYHNRYTLHTAPEQSQMRWDPTVRRIVRDHNFRLPSYRNAFAKDAGVHTRFD